MGWKLGVVAVAMLGAWWLFREPQNDDERAALAAKFMDEHPETVPLMLAAAGPLLLGPGPSAPLSATPAAAAPPRS